MLKKLMIAAGVAAALSAGSVAQATTARDYNVLVRNNFTASGSDVEGWVAAGGAISVGSYSIGLVNPAGAGQYAAVAGGSFTGNNGTVHGSALAASYAGPYSFVGGSPVTYAGGGVAPLDIGAEMDRLTDLSDDLAANAASYGTVGTYQLMYNQLFLVGTDDRLNVFNISAADWSNTLYGWHLATKPGSLTVFNVGGTNVSIANSGSDNGTFNGQNVGFAPQAYDSSRVLYNFFEATNLVPIGSVNATILAPTADFNSTFGVVLGQVFAKSFSGSIQVNHVPFRNFGDGTNILDPIPNAVPEPASWAMMIAGFALAGAAVRRRRVQIITV